MPPKHRYADYINSDQWSRRRVRYFKGHVRSCWCCEATDQVDLHHLTYDRMGEEPDDDLMPLCARCHDVVHAFDRARHDLSLRDATMFAIANMRASRVKATAAAAVKFVPLRQRIPEAQRRSSMVGGRFGRMGGLPIRAMTAQELREAARRRPGPSS